jgi:hypothetical protein
MATVGSGTAFERHPHVLLATFLVASLNERATVRERPAAFPATALGFWGPVQSHILLLR